MNLPKIQLKIIDTDAQGYIINATEYMNLNTPVQAWLEYIHLGFSGAATTMTDYTNTSRSAAFTQMDVGTILGGAGSVTQGIILGTGTTAVALADYKLGTPIAHGTGAGQLTYGATTILTAPTTSGTSRYFEATRAFTNGSGGNITVNEVGLYYYSGLYSFLFERSLNTHTINNGTTSTYVYKFTLTV